jgi:hypothetical protein
MPAPVFAGVKHRFDPARRMPKMPDKPSAKKKRKRDPYLDRRSGDDRREVYDADYFENDGEERRKGGERRKKKERRDDCTRISDWSSICTGDKK